MIRISCSSMTIVCVLCTPQNDEHTVQQSATHGAIQVVTRPGLSLNVTHRVSGVVRRDCALDEAFAANSLDEWLFAPADFPSLLPSEIPVQLLLATSSCSWSFRYSYG